ncbi:hypothetical protein NLI96_g13361 [Meripilus lineatus]|uniref:Uncharacterized protein n=1 Tax=Meripilus lineatus TaxID=2056292 RepID=A0AAD5UPL6_9APHY|nr:hypothetical protein NLI96_g13361 [Physisporinus lineatus]
MSHAAAKQPSGKRPAPVRPASRPGSAQHAARPATKLSTHGSAKRPASHAAGKPIAHSGSRKPLSRPAAHESPIRDLLLIPRRRSLSLDLLPLITPQSHSPDPELMLLEGSQLLTSLRDPIPTQLRRDLTPLLGNLFPDLLLLTMQQEDPPATLLEGNHLLISQRSQAPIQLPRDP